MLNIAGETNIFPDCYVVEDEKQLIERLDSMAADIIIMQREPTPDLETLIRNAEIQEKRRKITRELAELEVIGLVRELGISNDALQREMVRSIDLFAGLFQQDQIEVRMDLTDRQSCPKFHCDNVYVRMLVTYFGPTTEFIDRREPDNIYRVPMNSLVFLKGHKHPKYQDRILHRSPSFSHGERRFSMVINFSDWL
jgi:hypothetical protein